MPGISLHLERACLFPGGVEHCRTLPEGRIAISAFLTQLFKAPLMPQRSNKASRLNNSAPEAGVGS
jgi:hypothetical protein